MSPPSELLLLLDSAEVVDVECPDFAVPVVSPSSSPPELLLDA